MPTLDQIAEAADRDDPAPARDRFVVTETAYFAGNSLGLPARAAAAATQQRLSEWAELQVEGWFEAGWLEAAADLTPAMARIVGAEPAEVAIAGTLTTNLHMLLAALYRPTADRFRILIDPDAFPSDRYAVRSHVAWHGLDPDDAVREGGAADIDGTVAVTLLAAVSYVSGAVADIPGLTTRAHAAGALAVWDLAHGAGNIELDLHGWDVDAAAWCGYKYLNGGPGAPAAMYVAERHFGAPRLAGWWGVDPATRFRMEREFAPGSGAQGFVLSTPSILALAPLAASLAEFDAVGMPALSARSQRLTAFLAAALEELCGDRVSITPEAGERRSCQLSVHVPNAVERCAVLRRDHDVVCDSRPPDVLRFAPVPLSSTYTECTRAARALAASL